MFQFATRRVDKWIVLSSRNASLHAGLVPCAIGHVCVIRPGLPKGRFPAKRASAGRRSLGLPEDAFVVGTVGRLATQKRHDLLVQAAAIALGSVPNLYLVIVGDGELREVTSEWARRDLPDRTILTGHRSDIPDLMDLFDVFCLSSDYEGLPFALLEAMACGRAVLSTDVQGSGEAVEDEVSGLLVPPGNPGTLAASIVRLAGDPVLRRELGENARIRFETEFNADLMVDRTIALYRSLEPSILQATE